VDYIFVEDIIRLF